MEIITDVDALRQVSEPIEQEEVFPVLKSLLDALPEDALGLSAPQIGIFKRVFLARFSFGLCAFVNPFIKSSNSNAFGSTEGCLSLPGITRTVSRNEEILVGAKAFYSDNGFPNIEGFPFSLNPMKTMTLSGLDSAVFQHELDHLEGTLIIDLPQSPLPAEVIKIPSIRPGNFAILSPNSLIEAELRNKKRQKVSKRKLKQSNNNVEVNKINPKNKAKQDKQLKAWRKKNKRRVEIEEFQKAVAAGTISGE